MKHSLKFSLLLIILLGAANAHATFYLEPYAGYFSGNINQEVTIVTPPISATADDSASGMAFGGKVGFGIPMFAAGVDYMSGSIKAGGTTTKTTDIGGFFSATVPTGIKFSGTYFFSSQAKDSSSETTGSG